jgi:hypothetical protein
MVMRSYFIPMLVLFGALLGSTSSVYADCTFKETAPFIYNYEGDIDGKYRIRLSIETGTDRLRGVYIYLSSLKDITIVPKLIDARTIELDELDEKGTVARFKGVFQAKDPRGKYGDALLQCEVIAGEWIDLRREDRRLPFYLRLDSITGGTLDHRYASVGVKDDEIVNSGALKLWKGLKENNRQAVAECFHYPTIMATGRRKTITLNSPEDLVRHFDKIFPQSKVERLLTYFPRHMFVKYTGIMLGSGQIWFGPDGKVLQSLPSK